MPRTSTVEKKNGSAPPPAAWPADKVERWAIDRLMPYARNPNLHSPEQVGLIMASIRQWGWTVPVLVDDSGMIIAGHGRVMAAERLGIKEVPVMVAEGWSDEQKRAYVIADNQIPRQSEFDVGLLKAEIADLRVADFDLSLLGFGDVQMVEFTTGMPGAGGAAGEAAPERELTEEEQKKVNTAWRALAIDWRTIILESVKRGFVSTSYTRGALAVHFVRALLYGYDIPRSATSCYAPHRMLVAAGSATVTDGSLVRLFNSIEKDDGVAKSIAWKMQGKPSFDSFINSQMPMKGCRQPSDFPAHLARDLMNEFCKKGGRVLDPCHGWGGRLLGFLLSHAAQYHGFDVDPLTQKGVRQMADDLAPYVDGKRVQLTLQPYEDADLPKGLYDFALTSPPYFNVERYDGEQSSWRRHGKSFDAWVQGFYAPLFDNTSKALKMGGAFALQVGSQSYPLEKTARELAPLAGFEVVETRSACMINNYHQTEEDDGEVIVILRKVGAPVTGKKKAAAAATKKKADTGAEEPAQDPAAKFGEVMP